MAELDQDTIMKLGQLLGEFKGLHKRFDTIETDLRNGVDSMHKRLTDHENREEPRLQKIERLIWLGVGGLTLVAALIPVGLFIVQYTLAKV